MRPPKFRPVTYKQTWCVEILENYLKEAYSPGGRGSLFSSLFLFLLPRIDMWWLELQQSFWTIRWTWVWSRVLRKVGQKNKILKNIWHHYAPRSVQNIFPVWNHLIFTEILWDGYFYYPHSTDAVRKRKGNFLTISWPKKEWKSRQWDSAVRRRSSHCALPGLLTTEGLPHQPWPP